MRTFIALIMKKALIALSIFVAGFSTLNAQNPGDPDPSFGSAGKAQTIFTFNQGYMSVLCITLQADGKSLVVYDKSYNDGRDSFYLMRFLPEGSPDMSFGVAGIRKIDMPINRILVRSDSKILLVGMEGDEITLAGYLSNGMPDGGFGTQGKVSTGIFTNIISAAVQSDGKILLCGNAMNNSMMLIARLNADGERDFGFGTDGIILSRFGTDTEAEYGRKVIVQPDGKILLAGMIYKTGLAYATVTRFKADGLIDSSFSSDGKQTLNYTGFNSTSILVQNDNRIVVGGNYYYNNYQNSGLAFGRLHPNGNADSTFGINGIKTTNFAGSYDFLTDLALQTDGKIMAIGSSNGKFGIIRLTTTGVADPTFSGDGKQTTSFGTGTTSYGYAIRITPDGKFAMCGHTYVDDSTFAFSMVQYLSGFHPGMPELKSDLKLKVYPNPAQSYLFIEYELAETDRISMALFDMQGKCIKEFLTNAERKTGPRIEQLNVENICPGTYFLMMSGCNTNRTAIIYKE